MINKHYFKAHFVQKQAKRKLTFLTKIMWNPYFYNPGGLVFLTSWSIYLVTCWLHDVLIYLLNYCSTGISSYWLNNWAIYWLWLDLLTEWLVVTVSLLVDCMTVLVYFFVYLLWTLWWIPKSVLYYAKYKGNGY